MTKSDKELRRLADLGVNELYIGYETGLDDVLSFMNKGSTLDDSIRQAERLNEAGIIHHALLLLGAAGKGRGEESGLAAAKLINAIRPGIARFTTLSIFEGSELEEDVKAGRFTEAGELEILTEEKTCLENIELPDVLFQANHMLNSAPVQGYVGRDREWMLKKLTRAIEEFDEEQFRKTFKRTGL